MKNIKFHYIGAIHLVCLGASQMCKKVFCQQQGVGGRGLGVGKTALEWAWNPHQRHRLENPGLVPLGCWGCIFPHTRHPTPHTQPQRGLVKSPQFIDGDSLLPSAYVLLPS